MTRRWLVVLQVVLGIAWRRDLAQAGLSWLASARAARCRQGTWCCAPADRRAGAGAGGEPGVWSGGKDGLALFDTRPGRSQCRPDWRRCVSSVPCWANRAAASGSRMKMASHGVPAPLGQDASIVHYSSLAAPFQAWHGLAQRDRTEHLWAGSDPRAGAAGEGVAFVAVPLTPRSTRCRLTHNL